MVLTTKEASYIIVLGIVISVLLISSTNEGSTRKMKDPMKKRFQMHNLGSIYFYPGMNIERNRVHHPIHINQHRYI